MTVRITKKIKGYSVVAPEDRTHAADDAMAPAESSAPKS